MTNAEFRELVDATTFEMWMWDSIFHKEELEALGLDHEKWLAAHKAADEVGAVVAWMMCPR